MDHVSDVLRELRWLTATQLHTYHALCLLKRLLTNSEPRALMRKLTRRRDVRQTQTRQDNDLSLPTIKTEYGRRGFFLSNGWQIYRFPARITQSRIGVFKRRLHGYLADAKSEIIDILRGKENPNVYLETSVKTDCHVGNNGKRTPPTDICVTSPMPSSLH